MGFWGSLGKGLLEVGKELIPGGDLIASGVQALIGGGGGGGGSSAVAPIVVSSASGIGKAVATVATGGTSMSVPVQTGGLPALAGMATAVTAQTQKPGGILPWWRGPGGKLQFPWDDPQVPTFLKQFALDDAYLKQCVRAPRGFVVVRDKQKRPYAIKREIAIKMGIWKPAQKPLLTSTDVRALRRADRLEKTIKKISKRYGEKTKTVYRDKKSRAKR